MSIALVHDYVTQRGGAERVVLAMLRAFPGAPLYTSLYEPELTFPEFADADVRPLAHNRWSLLRRNHRLALPLLAGAFSRLHVEADVVLCSSSGWAHGVQAAGRKVVYCHTPARWLYQTNGYLGGRAYARAAALAVLRRRLVRWDRAAAATPHRYLANSRAVQKRIADLYRIDAELLPAPHAMDARAPQRAVAGLDDGFVLCVARLLPYKNVDAVIDAFRALPGEQLVVAGSGPEEERLRRNAPANVRVLGRVVDDELRWLYAHSRGLVAASYEDYGLTPLEAAAFGKPTAALGFGGFLDTIRDGVTGVFFDRPEPRGVAHAVSELLARDWAADEIVAHAARFSESRFAGRLREIAAEESALA